MKPWLEDWTAHQQGYDKRPDGGRYGSLSFGEMEDSVYATTLERAQLAAAAPALVRALLAAWPAVEAAVDGGDEWARPVLSHIDAALTAAGLPCQRSRDAARADIAKLPKEPA